MSPRSTWNDAHPSSHRTRCVLGPLAHLGVNRHARNPTSQNTPPTADHPHTRVLPQRHHRPPSHRRLHQRHRPPHGHCQPTPNSRRHHHPAHHRHHRPPDAAPSRPQAQRRELHD